MDKACPFHSLAHKHFQRSASPGKHNHTKKLENNNHQIHQAKTPDPVQGLFINKMINGISLEQRQGNVYQRTDQVKDQNDGHGFLKWL